MPEAVEFHFEKDVTKNHVAVKHYVKTLLPQCDDICTTDEWQTHMLGEMNDELNATKSVHANFKHKKMQDALKRMEVYNAEITSDKLLTDATSTHPELPRPSTLTTPITSRPRPISKPFSPYKCSSAL